MGSAHARFKGAPEGSSCLEGDGLKSTDSFTMSRAKTFGGMVILPDAIFASSSNSLYLRGT
jgi:hypothetical protein